MPAPAQECRPKAKSPVLRQLHTSFSFDRCVQHCRSAAATCISAHLGAWLLQALSPAAVLYMSVCYIWQVCEIETAAWAMLAPAEARIAVCCRYCPPQMHARKPADAGSPWRTDTQWCWESQSSICSCKAMRLRVSCPAAPSDPKYLAATAAGDSWRLLRLFGRNPDKFDKGRYRKNIARFAVRTSHRVL